MNETYRTVAARIRREVEEVQRVVVRNVYTLDFDPQQIEFLVHALPGVMEEVHSDLLAFAEVLEEIAAPDE